MRSTTTRRNVTAGLVGGAILALAIPAMASAHVSVSPDELIAGDHGVLTFSFAHGCENSPTTSLKVTMPEGLASVAPTMDSDWTIDIEKGDDGLVSAVTYTAVEPVPNELRGAVSMAVGLDEDTPDSLAFPVIQTCVEGSTEWTQLAEEGEDPHSLEAPAPVVQVAAAADAHGEHGSAEEAADSDASGSEAAEETDSSSQLGTALGAGGLVAGIAALVVSVLAYRRKA
ncbi:YcnI family protein [Microbacterium sp. APC 3901]|uniref:YcnI family copper-binding membrane protein n=1 Tax=Microbacterium sp. APC 3901 TaxID=3035192 RepID=UPI0025B3CCE7|nr:YcnI family protein [Microbacterium sp. APC 3901]MDN3443383.1 YcnI family protein [Microbacterium sp. APC 3901]